MACSEFCIDLATAISCECGVMGRSGPGQTAEQYKREDAWFEKYDAFLKMTTGEGLRERELREERKYDARWPVQIEDEERERRMK